MRSENRRIYLLHIRENILLAQAFTGSMRFEEFRADTRTVYAVIRCLEIISEASRRVDDAVKVRYRDLPWEDMAGAGNIYRHDYEKVRETLVWKTVNNALPRLLAVVEAELAQGGDIIATRKD